jgi:transcriptional antiterminator RfaH
MVNPCWAVAISAPQCERRAAEHITEQGFEVFYPRLKKLLVRHGKKHFRLDPLFPRYLFVCVQDAWRLLLGTRDVIDVIRSGEKPVLVPQAIVDEIKARCDRDGFYREEKKRFDRFRRRSSVRVKCGPFFGRVGIYQGMTPHEREVVLFNMLGRVVRIDFKVGDLTAA